MTVVQQLSLAFSGLKPILVVRVFNFSVFHIMTFSNVLKQVFDVGVLLLAETAVLLDFLVHPLHVHFKVTLAQAVK